MRLSIIIVNFRSASLIIECLRSLYKQEQGSFLKFEVIIVDNDSGDDSKQVIMEKFPDVRWIQISYNSGFARANNTGIKNAREEIVLLLNPDTLIENNAIAKCVEKLAASNYIAGGVQLLNLDKSPQISGNYFIQGGLNQLMALPYTGRFIRWLGYTFKVKKTNVPEAKGTVEVDWINGAFLMVKKEAIGNAGFMDEDFFLYFEEIEWCSRLRKIGKLCIYGDLHVVHLQGASANEAFGSTGQGYYNLYDRKGLQIMVSGLLRIRKQYGAGWFMFHLLFYLFNIPIFFFGVLLSLPFKPKMKFTFRQWSSYVKNCMKLLMLSGRIIRNKPYFYKLL